ncbi:MAG: hypothetical protein V1921_05400 [Candidatus Altiarchaeota archaeon]
MEGKEFERKASVIIVLTIVAFAVGYYVINPDTSYKHNERIAGVSVKSNIPLEDLSGWDDIGLLKSDDLAILACNFELSAVSGTPVSREYIVNVEKGEQGVYVENRANAYIRGMNSSELLDACHVFACLISNVSCSDKFLDIDTIFWNTNAINVIIDGNISGPGTRAYAELLGPIAFYQAQHADINRDGIFQNEEILENDVFIIAYIREGDVCAIQPMTNAIQKVNASNETVDCDLVKPAIVLEESPANEIRIIGDNTVYLYGNAERLHAEAIIIGDIIAPAWNLRFHGVE